MVSPSLDVPTYPLVDWLNPVEAVSALATDAVLRHQVAAGGVGVAGVAHPVVVELRVVVDVQLERRRARVVEGGLHQDHRTRRVGDVGLGDREVAVVRGVDLLPDQRAVAQQRDRVRGAGGLELGERRSVRSPRTAGRTCQGCRSPGRTRSPARRSRSCTRPSSWTPSESAKPVTLGSSQVAFAPGAPGAEPWALADGAAAEASPASRTSDPPKMSILERLLDTFVAIAGLLAVSARGFPVRTRRARTSSYRNAGLRAVARHKDSVKVQTATAE